MNATSLTGLYDRLTPTERLPLINAAVERGDELDENRLAHSAPSISLQLPDYHGLSDGWLMLSMFYMIEQLDLAVLFWRNLGLSAECQSSSDDAEDVARADRLFDLARFAGYRLCVEADAWKLVCSEGNYNPEGMLQFLDGFQTLQQAETTARMWVWTREEAAAYLKRIGKEDLVVPTVEGAAQGMREFLESRVKWWDE